MKRFIYILGLLVLSLTSFSETIVQKSISLDTAQKLAVEVIKEARKEKVNVSLVILDKGGNVVLSMKDDNAAIHTMNTAQKKAFTALSFGIPTTEFASRVEKVPNLTQIENTTTLGGGIPIKVGNETIGSIGIGGAPSGTIDEKIGNAALSKISTLLK
jgi:uncharacterized protein GlcG (DUF336 family)